LSLFFGTPAGNLALRHVVQRQLQFSSRLLKSIALF
jgi:hypothetical protein